MKTKRLWLFTGMLALFVCLLGCSIQGKRLFQKAVPAPLTKPATQVETERQGADLIARTVQQPEALKPVAQALSESLGKPEHPLPAANADELIKSSIQVTEKLTGQIVAMQKDLAKLNLRLTEYQGKAIEGTGFSILGPGMVTVVLGLIVLGCIFPPVFTVLAFMYRRLKAAGSIVVNEIEAAGKAPETQAAVSTIKDNILKAMKIHPAKTEVLKSTVSKLKTV